MRESKYNYRKETLKDLRSALESTTFALKNTPLGLNERKVMYKINTELRQLLAKWDHKL